MSWLFSRALVEDFTAAASSAGNVSAPSSTTLMPDQFYWPDKTTEHSRLSRYGTTCEPLTESLGEELLTWFRADSLARTYPLVVTEPELKDQEAGSGLKWLELLARYDHDSRGWKTPQCSLVEGSDVYSRTWPRCGLMLDGECWELPQSALLISVSEFGFLDSTPTKVMPVETDLPPERIRFLASGRPRKISKAGTDGSMNWAQLMLHKGFLPTPTLCEYYMGWPIGATDLAPLATGKFQQWQQQHGAFSEAP